MAPAANDSRTEPQVQANLTILACAVENGQTSARPLASRFQAEEICSLRPAPSSVPQDFSGSITAVRQCRPVREAGIANTPSTIALYSSGLHPCLAASARTAR